MRVFFTEREGPVADDEARDRAADAHEALAARHLDHDQVGRQAGAQRAIEQQLGEQQAAAAERVELHHLPLFGGQIAHQQHRIDGVVGPDAEIGHHRPARAVARGARPGPSP